MTKKAADSFCIPLAYKPYIGSVYASEGEITSRVEKLAHDIGHFYGHDDYTILVILKGSIFINDIL
jgi:hypoxanthine-guanine phosphoribosyltransferase